MSLLPPIMYGVDVALSRIRPHATYQLEGRKFTIWNDPTGSKPPTWDEIYAQITKDQAEIQAISQAHKVENAPVASLANSFSVPFDQVNLPPAPSISVATEKSSADTGHVEPVTQPNPPNM